MNKKVSSLLIVASTIAIMLLSVIIYFPTGDKITGRPTTPTSVGIIFAPPHNCSFNINSGWNMVSFFCLSTATPRSDALQSIDGNYTKIFAYKSSDSLDPWKSYNPSLPSWAVQQLNYVDRMSGYWIYMNYNSYYQYSGYERASIIALNPGWNFIGYPSLNNQSVNDSLSGVYFNVLKHYDTDSGTYEIYIVNATNNTLNYTETYKGYWINSTASQNWNVNP
jgi:hypothetical protein